MLEQLDQIDWSKLKHAYGEASDVPELIRALRSDIAEERKNALSALYGNIFHQGTRYQATSKAIPFLVELIEDKSTPDRLHLLPFLVSLALGYEDEFLPYGIDPARLRTMLSEAERTISPEDKARCEEFGYHPRNDIECYDAVLRAVPGLIEATQDSDKWVARGAVYALAWFPEAAHQSAPVLTKLVETSTDPFDVANAILALGLLARTSDHKFNFPDVDPRLGDEHLLVRVAVGLALWEDPLQEVIVKVLVEAMMRGDELAEDGDGLLFNSGDLVSYSSLVLALSAPENHAMIVDVLVESLKGRNCFESLTLTKALLEIVYAQAEESGENQEGFPLNDVQRAALEGIAEHGGWKRGDAMFLDYSELLNAYGFPGEQEDLVKLLKESS